MPAHKKDFDLKQLAILQGKPFFKTLDEAAMDQGSNGNAMCVWLKENGYKKSIKEFEIEYVKEDKSGPD